jgi:hypothetical protein
VVVTSRNAIKVVFRPRGRSDHRAVW